MTKCTPNKIVYVYYYCYSRDGVLKSYFTKWKLLNSNTKGKKLVHFLFFLSFFQVLCTVYNVFKALRLWYYSKCDMYRRVVHDWCWKPFELSTNHFDWSSMRFCISHVGAMFVCFFLIEILIDHPNLQRNQSSTDPSEWRTSYVTVLLDEVYLHKKHKKWK